MSAGRPTIDGKPAGTSPRAISCTVTLSTQDVEYLRSMGGESRNLSAAIRRMVAESRKQAAAGQLVSPEEAERYLNALHLLLQP